MNRRFSEQQIISILKEVRAGTPVKYLSRKYDFSLSSYYLWRSRYKNLEEDSPQRINALERELRRVRHLLANALLEAEMARAALKERDEDEIKFFRRRAFPDVNH